MFATDSAYGDLLVVVTPQQGPVIHGAKSRFKNVLVWSFTIFPRKVPCL